MMTSATIWIEDEELLKKINEWDKKYGKKMDDIILEFLPEDFGEKQLVELITKVIENDEDDFKQYLPNLPKSYFEQEKKYEELSKNSNIFL